MVCVIMADADIFDLIGLDVDLGQLIDNAHLRGNIGRRHGVSGIPQHIFVAMLDEITTEDELKLQAGEGIGIRESLIDYRWCLWRAAIQSAQCYVCSLRGCRKNGEK